MNKKIFLSFLGLFLILIAGFVSAGDLTISDTVNTVGASVNPAGTIQGSFKVNNVNTVESITNIDLSSTTFTTGSNTIPSSAIVFSPDPISSIAASGSQSVSFTITMPTNQIPGTYTGTITASDLLQNSTTTPVSFTVNTLQKLTITDRSTSNPLALTSEDDNTVSGTFTIKNDGNVDLTFSDSSITHNVDLDDGDGHNMTLSFTSIPTSLTPGSSDAITVTANIPNRMQIGTYSGDVTAASGSANANFTLEISVQPEVCKDGPVGELEINIDDPDNGDEFAPGETIDIEVSVENNDNDEMDVGVTAFLYNIDEDDNIVEEDSEVIEIGDSDEETFDFELKLPFDGGLDEGDNFKLFVKAFEDGDEDSNCAQDNIDIEIKREKHDVRVDDVSLSPSVASCGDGVEARIDVLNVGSSDEDDVYVQLKNSELGLDEKSEIFDLDSGNDKDNDFSTSILFNVPEDTDEKEYQIETVVYYDDGDEKSSKFVTLSVEDCDGDNGTTTPPPAAASKAEIEVVATSIGAKDNTFSIPVKVTNKDENQATYVVEMANIGDWADSVNEKTLTLNKDQASTVYFYVKASKDIYGKQSATLNVKDQGTGKVVATQTLTLDLGEKPGEPIVPAEESLWGRIKGYFSDSTSGTNGTVFWIILDVVLVVVAIVFIKILFTRKKKD